MKAINNSKIFKVGKFYTKKFETEKQMMNYYKKIVASEKKYRIVTCALSSEYGYICQWCY